MEIVLFLAGLLVGGVIAWAVALARERDARIRAETQRAQAQQGELLLQADQRLTDTFKALADDALKSNNRAFLELAQQSMETTIARSRTDLVEKHQELKGLVTPIQEALSRYQQQATELENSRRQAYGGPETHLKTLAVEPKDGAS